MAYLWLELTRDPGNGFNQIVDQWFTLTRNDVIFICSHMYKRVEMNPYANQMCHRLAILETEAIITNASCWPCMHISILCSANLVIANKFCVKKYGILFFILLLETFIVCNCYIAVQYWIQSLTIICSETQIWKWIQRDCRLINHNSEEFNMHVSNVRMHRNTWTGWTCTTNDLQVCTITANTNYDTESGSSSRPAMTSL